MSIVTVIVFQLIVGMLIVGRKELFFAYAPIDLRHSKCQSQKRSSAGYR